MADGMVATTPDTQNMEEIERLRKAEEQEKQRTAIKLQSANVDKDPGKQAQPAVQDPEPVAAKPVATKPAPVATPAVKPAPTAAPAPSPTKTPQDLQRTDAEQGLSVRELMTKKRLEGGPTKLQQQKSRGERDKMLEIEQRGMEGYIAEEGGRVSRQVGKGAAARYKKKTPTQRQAEEDWKAVSFAMKDKMAPANTLEEYRSQFEQMKEAAGEGAVHAGEQIEEDFIRNMPDAVKKEYSEEKQGTEYNRESEQLAGRQKVLQIARAEATKEMEDSGLGKTLRDIRNKDTKSQTKAGLEEKQAHVEATAEYNREKTRQDALYAAGTAIEIADKQKLSELQFNMDNAKKKAEVYGAEQEAKLGVDTKLVPAVAAKAKATKAAELATEDSLLGQTGQLTRKKAAQARAIEQSLPASNKEQAVGYRNQYSNAYAQYENRKKELAKLELTRGTVKDGKFLFVDKNALRELRKNIKQAEVDMEYYDDKYKSATGIQGDSPLLREAQKKTPKFTQHQQNKLDKYNEKLAEFLERTDLTEASANTILTGKGWGKGLDDLWKATGQPISAAPHSMEVEEDEFEDLTPTAEQTPEMKPADVERKRIQDVVLNNESLSIGVKIAMLESYDMTVPEGMRAAAEAESTSNL